MADISQDQGESNLKPWEEMKAEFSAHYPSVSDETKFERFFRKINQFFQKEPEPNSQLKGRIHELQQNADQVLKELIEVKKELKNEIEPSLFAFVETVVDPLFKEVKRIQKEMEKNDSMSQYIQVFKRYTAWIDKAKMWVELCSSRNKKEAISKAVIEYNIQEFNAIVERDLQVINDYFNHTLDRYQMEANHEKSLKQKVENDLLPHIASLQKLQRRPDALTLFNLSLWRSQFDQQREKHFSTALHIIDTLIQKENPFLFDEEEGEYYADVIIRMKSLEERINGLMSINLMDVSKKKVIALELAKLEEDAHHLNLDLRLSHESSEQLQALMQRLDVIRQKLDI